MTLVWITECCALWFLRLRHGSHQDVPYKKVDFEEQLISSDMISLHLPIVSDTHQLINETALHKMKTSSLLINTVITSHTASLTATTFNQMCVSTVQNVVDLLAGKVIDEQCIFNRAAL